MPVTLPVSYTSVSRIQSAFPAVNSVTTITSAVICQFAGDTEAYIRARLRKKYTLPLTVECPLLTALATRMSIYKIAVDRGLVHFPPAQQGRSPMQETYKQDMATLDELVAGEIDLIDINDQIISTDVTQVEAYSTTKDYVPTFHEGATTDWVRDPQKLEDIESDRDLTPHGRYPY